MEVEIKLHVEPEIDGGPAHFFDQVAKVASLGDLPLGPARRIALRDVYFDTADHALAKTGAGLRLRMEDDQALVTLKLSHRQDGALAARQEYEEPLTSEGLEGILAQLRPVIGPEPIPLDRFASGRTAGPLQPVLDVVTDRLARSVGEVAVLTLDRVTYPGLTVQSYWDIEVESRTGENAEPFLRRVERELTALAKGRLSPGSISKLERGLRLRSE